MLFKKTSSQPDRYGYVVESNLFKYKGLPDKISETNLTVKGADFCNDSSSQLNAGLPGIEEAATHYNGGKIPSQSNFNS